MNVIFTDESRICIVQGDDAGKCYEEECADSDPCDLNTDLLPTNICVEMECATGVHVTRNGRYVNGCLWCNGYRRRKWTRPHEFKSWTRLISFHIALIPLGKV